MRTKNGKSREEILLFPPSLEQFVGADNIVRLIDAFVDVLNLKDFGFIMNPKKKHEPGAPSYACGDLLKIYLYGYLNRTTSSRQLEKMCQVNVEVMWLINGLQPRHMTINNFRKENPKGLKEVFRAYNRFLDTQQLYGKETIAVDGSKFRGQNARKNSHNERSLKQKEAYLEKQYEEYFALLDKSDKEDSTIQSKNELEQYLAHLDSRKQKCEKLKIDLAKAKEKGDLQISTTDPDVRKMKVPNYGVDMCVNVQSAVDDKHCLIAGFEVTSKDDKNALSQVAIQVKKEFKVDKLTALADAGYYTASELKKCADEQIETYVSPLTRKTGPYSKEAFIYNPQDDTYTCPNGKLLTTNGKWLKRKAKPHRFKSYTGQIGVCEKCPFVKECISKARLKSRHAKKIDRREFESYVEANDKRVKENKDYYRKRAQIVEHPFGTIKRNWGYTYCRLRGLEKIEGEFSLIFLCYNLRRTVSILGVKELIVLLKAMKKDFFNFIFWFMAIYSGQIVRKIENIETLAVKNKFKML